MMRTKWLSVLLLASFASSAALAAEREIYLDSIGLANLQQSNPQHYARAQKILAQASEVCSPGVGKPVDVKMEYPFQCSGFMLKSSYPAKREIRFALDSTRYIAMVSLKSEAQSIPLTTSAGHR